MVIGDTPINLELEDWKGIIEHVNKYNYLEAKITNDGDQEPEVNDGINKGKAVI